LLNSAKPSWSLVVAGDRPTITVQGRLATEVEASALPKPESVGIDGLLGQSFLKALRITSPPGANSPVQLNPRYPCNRAEVAAW
jgi:hypothetical protein